jgi:hypothetical protein
MQLIRVVVVVVNDSPATTQTSDMEKQYKQKNPVKEVTTAQYTSNTLICVFTDIHQFKNSDFQRPY